MTGETRFNIPLLDKRWKKGKLKKDDVEFLEKNNICYVFRHNGKVISLLPFVHHIDEVS